MKTSKKVYIILIFAVLAITFVLQKQYFVPDTIGYTGQSDSVTLEFNSYRNYEDFLENKDENTIVYNTKSELKAMDHIIYLVGTIQVEGDVEIEHCKLDIITKNGVKVSALPLNNNYEQGKSSLVMPFIAYGNKNDVYEQAIFYLNEEEPLEIQLNKK